MCTEKRVPSETQVSLEEGTIPQSTALGLLVRCGYSMVVRWVFKEEFACAVAIDPFGDVEFCGTGRDIEAAVADLGESVHGAGEECVYWKCSSCGHRAEFTRSHLVQCASLIAPVLCIQCDREAGKSSGSVLTEKGELLQAGK